MNALVRKETRLLLPAWSVALVAATLPLTSGWVREMTPGFFVMAILALCLSPFGQEMSCGTFGLLLVQPEERRRFWRIKTGLLVGALVSVWTLFVLCVWISDMHLQRDETLAAVLKGAALMTLLAFSGGLWTTLLLRDMVSSFFCAWLTPLAICAATLASVGHWVNVDSDRFITILSWVLAAYAAAGFWWARRLFLGARDMPWTGGQISLTVRGVSLKWLAFKFKSRQNRWTASVKKELQLQEITMFLIPVLALLHVVTLALYHLHPQWNRDKDLFYSAIPIIWLAAVPMVIGCVAVAEERRLNTLESLLFLPMAKLGQFAVKFAVALVLGIALGGVIPWLLLGMGGAWPTFKLQYAVEIAAAITGIAFYASTMSRSLLQALPTTVCIWAVAWMADVNYKNDPLPHATNLMFMHISLFPALVFPAMIITFVWLAFNNYKRLQIGWRVWVGDFTRAGAVFGCVTLATLAIFDRPWELFLPLEPRHGSVRISGEGPGSILVLRPGRVAEMPNRDAGRVGMFGSTSGLDVLLPDGRLWIGEMYRTVNLISDRFVPGPIKSVSGGFANGSNWVAMATLTAMTPTTFANGSNWMAMEASYRGAVALQTDGTLWRILNRSDITQIGSDSDWKEIAGGGSIFMAVKQDGTLWGWGVVAQIISGPPRFNWQNLNYSNPVRVGGDSDWVNVFVLNDGQVIGVKRDGSTWEWGDPGHPRDKNRSGGNMRMEGTNWSSMVSAWNLTLGIRTDGSLWASGYIPPEIFGERVLPGPHPQAVRVGTKSDWVALSEDWQFTALEANGTLWTMVSGQSKRPSKYADWLAATEEGQLTWGLAKDGTLTYWSEFGMNVPNDNAPFMQKFFLGPTRRPFLSINILDAQH